MWCNQKFLDDLESKLHEASWNAVLHSKNLKIKHSEFKPASPAKLQSRIIREGYDFINKAKIQTLPRAENEIMIGIVIAPKVSDIPTSLSESNILIERFKKLKVIIGYAVIPEPRHDGKIHYNAVIRINKSNFGIINNFIKNQNKNYNYDPIKIMRDKKTHKVFYRYEDHLNDVKKFRGKHIAEPLWYASKSLISKISSTKKARSLTELVGRKNLEESSYCSAVEAMAWRRHHGLRLTRISRCTENQPPRPGDVPPSTPMLIKGIASFSQSPQTLNPPATKPSKASKASPPPPATKPILLKPHEQRIIHQTLKNMLRKKLLSDEKKLLRTRFPISMGEKINIALQEMLNS